MNRRGFFGLVAKLAAVGAAMSVAPSLLVPIEKMAAWKEITRYVIKDSAGNVICDFTCQWVEARVLES